MLFKELMEQKKIISTFGILNRTFLSYITESLLEQNISYSDSIFLVNIGAKEGITQEEIANNLAIDKAAVARSVKNMQKKGYVRTVQSDLDRRAKELYLTETGKELDQLMLQINGKWMNYVLGSLSQEEIKTFSQTIYEIGMRAKEYNKPVAKISLKESDIL